MQRFRVTLTFVEPLLGTVPKEMTRMTNRIKLLKLKRQLRDHIAFVEGLLDNGRSEQAYHYVFNVDLSPLVELFGPIDYHDPDTTYEADTRAKLGQIAEYQDVLIAALGEEAAHE